MANIEIGGRLHSTATGNVVTGANEVLDDTKNKKQSVINAEVDETIGDDNTAGTIKGRIKTAEGKLDTLNGDSSTSGSVAKAVADAKTELIGGATSNGNTLKKVEDRTATLETAVGSNGSVDQRIAAAKSEVIGDAASDYNTLGKLEDKIQAEASARQDAITAETNRATTRENQIYDLVHTPEQHYVTVATYADLANIASPSDDTIYRVSSYNGNTSQVDNTVYSEYGYDGTNFVFLCVKSQIDEVYDISAHHSNNTYVDLAAALDGGNNIPQELRRGGMSVKFVQSSDNKYVQYRLANNSFSTSEKDWVIAADVKGKLLDNDFAIIDDNKNAIVRFSKGHIQTKNFDSEKVSAESSNKDILPDLAFTDINNNAIVQFGDGHIKTKNFDSSKINSGLRGMMGSYNGYNIITVGTGKDYPTIQEAINSVEDATIDNQYLIVVYDDFYVNSITDLYLDENRSQKVSSITDIDNGKTCAYVFTKDFVHIIGKGKRKIHVNIPTDVIDTPARLSCVHNIYWRGYSNIENIQVISQNTRYCIHSEGGGNSPSSEDYCVIKHLKDVVCIYKGVSPGGYSQALGIGTANGQKAFIDGCTFIGEDGARSGYSHTHPNYTYPTSLILKNTKFCDEGVFNSFELVELFSGQNNNLICESYEGKYLSVAYLIAQPVYLDTDFDIRHNRIELQGHGNKTRMGFETLPVLEIVANNIGDNITSVSGSAIEPLFKDFLRKIDGGLNAVSRWTGCLAHLYNGTNTYNEAFSAIAFNLGDCSVNNKTLSITVGSHTETITFDKNYGGLVGNVPTSNYTDDALIAEINSQLQYCQISKDVIMRRLFFSDEVEEVYNTSDYLLGMDKIVTRDANASVYMNGVRLAQSGDFVYGICAEPIPPHSYGYIIKKGKQKIYLSNGNETGLSNVAGKYYGVNENGLMTVTNKADACFFGIDNNTLEWI